MKVLICIASLVLVDLTLYIFYLSGEHSDGKLQHLICITQQ